MAKLNLEVDVKAHHTPDCFASYMGLWCIEPTRFQAMARAAKAGTLPTVQFEAVSGDARRRLFDLDASGIATIPINGTLMKGDSKFGGTSSIRTRRAVREAVADKDVRAILLHIDSPGGTVAGTDALARDVRAADKIKPVYTHVDDLMASAALWVGVGARRVTVSPTSEVGSIGVVAIAYDTSEAYEKEGVEVHVVTSDGAEKFKGAFADGSKVTGEQLDELKRRINGVADDFVSAVAKGGGGRDMPKEAVRKLATGQTWSEREAVARGLADAVASHDEALDMIRRDLKAAERESRARAQEQRMRMA